MNKKFTLSLLVVLVLIIGLPSLFAQSQVGFGTVTTSTTKPINALHTWIKATRTAQTADANGYYGLDTLTYSDKIGATIRGNNGIQLSAPNTNIVSSSGTQSQTGFIAFEDNANSTTVGAFKFYQDDTIYLTFQSKHSTSVNRFKFDQVANNNNIKYMIQGTGAQTMRFHLLDDDGNTFGGTAGTSQGTMGNTAYRGYTHDTATLAIVIDVAPSQATTNAQLLLSDIYIKPAGKWLQGKTFVADTLLVAYGRGGGSPTAAPVSQTLPLYFGKSVRHDSVDRIYMQEDAMGTELMTEKPSSEINDGWAYIPNVTWSTGDGAVSDSTSWDNDATYTPPIAGVTDITRTKLHGAYRWTYDGAISLNVWETYSQLDGTTLGDAALGTNAIENVTAGHVFGDHGGTSFDLTEAVNSRGNVPIWDTLWYMYINSPATDSVLVDAEGLYNFMVSYNAATEGTDAYYKFGPGDDDTLNYVWNTGTRETVSAFFERVLLPNAASIPVTMPITDKIHQLIFTAGHKLLNFGNKDIENFGGLDSIQFYMNQDWMTAPSRRVPVAVRRGNSFWAFNPGDSSAAFHNFFTNADQPAFNAIGNVLPPDHVGGAPILLINALPGTPDFVRWNVGFGGDGSKYAATSDGGQVWGENVPAPWSDLRFQALDFAAENKLTSTGDDGRLIPTIKRRAASGHRTGATTGFYDDQNPAVFKAHTIIDTVTRYLAKLDSAWVYQPDTLFVFDQDSNLVNTADINITLVAIDSARDGIITDLSSCGNAFGVRKYKETKEKGRVIYDWGFDQSNDAVPDRTRKIRLIGRLTNHNVEGAADTLNGRYPQILDNGNPTFGSHRTTTLTGLPGSTIHITAGPVNQMSVAYQFGGGSRQSFQTGITMPVEDAKTNDYQHKLIATLRDRCDNIVREGMVAFKIWAESNTYLDTTVVMPDSANARAGLLVKGNALNPGHPDAYLTPTVDTMFLWARGLDYADDRGQVTASFNTSCGNDTLFFGFAAYADSIVTGENITTGVGNMPLVELGGNQGGSTGIYKIVLTGSGSPRIIMISNSTNDYERRTPWPAPDEAFMPARAVDITKCSDQIDQVLTLRVTGRDDCNRELTFDNVDQVTFEEPVYYQGGWGTAASWRRGAPTEASIKSPPHVFSGAAYTTTNFTGKTKEEASGTGGRNTTSGNGGDGVSGQTAIRDSLGFYDGGVTGKTLSDDKKAIEIKYYSPTVANDTIVLVMSAFINGGETLRRDTTRVITTSTAPSTFRLYMRNVNVGDTTLTASRGDIKDSINTTFAYGLLRDCNNELVTGDFASNVRIYWRLQGPTRWSAFLFDPTLIYGDQVNGAIVPPTSGFFVTPTDSIFVRQGIGNPLGEFRGQRQWLGSINSADGKAYVGINTDTVGGSMSPSGSLVFPAERGTVFPGTPGSSIETFNTNDSITYTYTWDGSDDKWNRARRLNVNTGAVETIPNWGRTAINGTKFPMFTAFTAANVTKALRGYNELTADAYFVEGNTVRSLSADYDNTTGTLRSGNIVRYMVLSDQPNQIAWVDATGSFDQPLPPGADADEYQVPGLDFLNLYGRQAGKILVEPQGLSSRYLRLIVDTNNAVSHGLTNNNTGIGRNGTRNNDTYSTMTNYWWGGRNYAGRVDSLYVRVYDKFGNPADLPSMTGNIVIQKSVDAWDEGTGISSVNASEFVMARSEVAYSNTTPFVANSIYNQEFVGNTPIANLNTTSTAATGIKSYVWGGKLRGAIGVPYQTLSHTGRIRMATTTNADYAVPNVGDKQYIAAVLDIGSATTVSDTAVILSKPTRPLALYGVVQANTSTGRVQDGNIVLWEARDDVSEYEPETVPLQARLVWYDYRLANTQVIIGSSDTTTAPIRDLYPGMTPTGTANFFGYADISNDSGAILGYGTYNNSNNRPIYSLNNGAGGSRALFNQYTTVTDGVSDSRFGDLFPAILYNRFVSGTTNSANYLGTPRVNNDNEVTMSTTGFGFVGGRGRTLFSSLKSGTVRYAIMTQATTNTALYNANAYGVTASINVLPGRIHWVSMANPNSVDPSLTEAVYPYPLRRGYDKQIQFSNATGDRWNENTKLEGTDAINANPRSYANPEDILFIDERYTLELRTYDRFGNRNTIDSIYVSLEYPNPGEWAPNLWTSGSEVLLEKDGVNFAQTEIKNVFTELWARPVHNGTEQFKEYRTQLRLHYNAGPQSLNNQIHNKPDMLYTTMTGGTPTKGDMVVAFRDIWVKQLNPPGAPQLTNPRVVRLSTESKDFSFGWRAATSTNLPTEGGDGITYTLHFTDVVNGDVIEIPVPGVPTHGETNVVFAADVKDLADALGLEKPDYNRTFDWKVIATNKWNRSTSSGTVRSIFTLNQIPSEFKIDPTPAVYMKSGLNLSWTTPTDENSMTDFGTTTSIQSHGSTYTATDSIEYKIVFEKIDEYPSSTEGGIAALDNYELIATWKSAGRAENEFPVQGNRLQIPAAQWEALLGKILTDLTDAGPDYGSYHWYVIAKDNTLAAWDDPGYTRVSDTGKIDLSKVGEFAKILVDAANKVGQPVRSLNVTETADFTLSVFDNEDNLIRGFNDYPTNILLKPEGVIATDRTQKQTMALLCGDVALEGNIAEGFILPSSYFDAGKVTLTYQNRRAYDTISIVIPNDNPKLKGNDSKPSFLTIVGDATRRFATNPAPQSGISVKVMPRKAGTDTVFVGRAMEAVVTPSDVYDNDILVMENAIAVGITARYPEQIIGLSNQVYVQGRMNYFLTPTVARNDQYIEVYKIGDPQTFARSNSFIIAEHRPTAFTVTNPDHNEGMLELNTHDQRYTFAWTAATDRNNTPLVSTVPVINPQTGQLNYTPSVIEDQDVVTYSLRVKEIPSYVFPDSVNNDTEIRLTGTTLLNLAIALGGGNYEKDTKVSWNIVATDGLFETFSDDRVNYIKPMGIIDVDKIPVVPETFALGQNYPNPFNPTTQIQYDLPKASDVRLVIYNILGQPVRTLVNETNQVAGRYNMTWDGKNDHGQTVATGVYIYKINAGEFTATKKMNLLK